MRTIKFRAWDGEKMVVANDIVLSGDKPRAFWKENSCYESSEVLMQYTGLKDKNGVEIYEGDIVTCSTKPTLNISWPHKGLVEYLPDECYFGIRCGVNEDGAPQYTSFWNNKDFEVIGNVFQHPSLLTS